MLVLYAVRSADLRWCCGWSGQLEPLVAPNVGQKAEIKQVTVDH